MPVTTIYTLEESQVTVSGGEQLSGISQGDGSHLDGLFITLNSNAWREVLIEDDDANFSDNDGSQRLEGAQAYDGVSYADNLRVEAEFDIEVEDSNGVRYTLLAFNINEPGVASFRTVEGLAFVGPQGGFPPIGEALRVVRTGEGPSYTNESLATPLCFTAGSLVKTVDGSVPVEGLRPGDLVCTADGTAKPVRWVGATVLYAPDMACHPNVRPVLIKASALGPGRPVRDTRVSPQHRIAISGWRAELLFGEDEVLVPAIKLVNDHSVLVDCHATQVHYVHVLFDAHEVIEADGLLSESFFLGGSADHEAKTRAEILALFPEMKQYQAAKQAARPIIEDRRAKAIWATMTA
ncbi:MAG: Hint domain-containing protein [Marinovum sp.]|nr:Hint domain-containing protein [Marinovum sp.]